MRFQRPDRYVLVFRLRLEQDDRPDIVGVVLRRLGQHGAGFDGAVHRVLPGVVLGKHDGQLDHVGALEFLGADAVQDVRFRARRCRELDHGARVHPRLHVARQAGDGVVRLIDDHQGPVEVQQVGKGKLHGAAVQPFQARQRWRQRGEVRLHLLIVGVYLAPLGALDAQRLNGADHQAAAIPQVVRPDVGEVRNVEHPHPAVKRRVQYLPVRMTRVLQRLDRLPADGVARHQPQRQRIVLLDPGVAGNGHGMRGEDGLAAAGGQAQADVGHVRHLVQRRVGTGVPAQPPGLFWLAGDGLISVLGTGDACLLKETAQHRKGVDLVLFQFHESGPRLDGVGRLFVRVALWIYAYDVARLKIGNQSFEFGHQRGQFLERFARRPQNGDADAELPKRLLIGKMVVHRYQNVEMFLSSAAGHRF